MRLRRTAWSGGRTFRSRAGCSRGPRRWCSSRRSSASRCCGRARGWGAGRAGAKPRPRAYPHWLGRWPAAAGIVAFAWVELVYVDKDDPSKLAIMALAYAAVQLAGMAVYGIERWERDADPFAVYFW